MITTIKQLSPTHDYSKDDCHLIFYHNVKRTKTVEIKADWFDINYGNKVLWLIIREYKSTLNHKPRYKNIKLKNIDQTVKIQKNSRVRGEIHG